LQSIFYIRYVKGDYSTKVFIVSPLKN